MMVSEQGPLYEMQDEVDWKHGVRDHYAGRLHHLVRMVDLRYDVKPSLPGAEKINQASCHRMQDGSAGGTDKSRKAS